MTLELLLFVVVAAVAIFSAAFMLISRNAVHSALFLVVNLACVALFYLMLSAPFLAMIQITVYAGAIMVLFMFVIMLLGAERLSEQPARFRWVPSVASLLTAVFLVIALFVVVQGNISLFKPVAPQPEIRVVHALPGAPALDLYLNGTKALESVDYRGATRFAQVSEGQYHLLAFPVCLAPANCPDPIATKATPLLDSWIKVYSRSDGMGTTYVVAGAPSAPQLITVPTDLSPVSDEDTLRITAVNAAPGSQPASLLEVIPGQAKPVVLAADVSPLSAAPTITLAKGHYTLAWQQGDQRVAAYNDLAAQPKTSEMLILVQESVPGATASTQPALIRVAPVPVAEAFGSPQQIGLTLLGPFLLPFELVSLLLLAAMIGAIILTREEVVRRVRQRLVVSAAVRRINRVAAEPAPANPPVESPTASD